MLSVPMVIFYEVVDPHRPAHGAAQASGRTGLMGPAPGYDFALDPFQVRAIDALDDGPVGARGRAHRQSGKTVVAEHAVAKALRRGRQGLLHAPIKALSNQKFTDLGRRHGAERVGLLTGDNAINGDAPVVVMTTEVLRNMIYAGSPALRGLRYVVLDEVHFLQDAYRGPVWEEVIIHLPPDVALVCLSATVSNAEELADWITTVRGPTEAVIEERRPVELHNLYLRRRQEQPGPAPAATLVDGRPNPEASRLDDEALRVRGDAVAGPAAPALLHAAAGRGDRPAPGRGDAPGHHLHLQPQRLRRRPRRLPRRRAAAHHPRRAGPRSAPSSTSAPRRWPTPTSTCSASTGSSPGSRWGSPPTTPGWCRRSRRRWRRASPRGSPRSCSPPRPSPSASTCRPGRS